MIVTAPLFLTFSTFFFFILLWFFALPSLPIVTAPSACGVWGKRPWVVQDEIDKGKELWSRARMTECLHARSYRAAVAYRGQTSMGKGRWRGQGGTTDGGKITLLPTHLQPTGGRCCPGVPDTDTYEGGWLAAFVPDHPGASAHPAACSVPTVPHDPSALTALSTSLLLSLSRSSEHLAIFVSSSSSDLLKLALMLAFLPPGRPIQPVTGMPVFVASCSADATPG